jgi:hypothetical protein
VFDQLRRAIGHACTTGPDEHVRHVLLSVVEDAHLGSQWRLADRGGVVEDVDGLVPLLVEEIEHHVAEHSPTHVFVHAGVVAYRDVAIVLPGESHAGKSTAVEALVAAGGRYYSDEYAPLSAHGDVHPFTRPLNRRVGDAEHAVVLRGGGPPTPVGAVIFTRYAPGASWSPTEAPSGEGVLRMIANSVGARLDPDRALDAISAALDGALVLTGDRGEAADFADDLLARIRDR